MWDPVIDEDGYQIAYYVVYMFDASSKVKIDDPEHILLKTCDTEIELPQADIHNQKRVTFVVTSVNRYRQESIAGKKLKVQL